MLLVLGLQRNALLLINPSKLKIIKAFEDGLRM